jgi:uncharacterized membrane protein
LRAERIWEIDLLRAFAILLMVVFHLVFDLAEFVGLRINYLSGFWYWEGKTAALLFIFLAGISSGFSRNNIKRGLKVLAFGFLITLFTYLVFPEQYIRFGILHFLGTCMLLFPLLLRLPNILLLIGTVIIAAAALPLQKLIVNTFWLLPVGLMYSGYTSYDYYPLVPYLAVFILGILAYKTYYYRRQSLLVALTGEKAPEAEKQEQGKGAPENGNSSNGRNTRRLRTWVRYISKNSLAIYLLHQPVLVALVFLGKKLVEALG